MKREIISLENAIKKASKKILLPGLKPEDYFVVGEDFPLRIAKMVVKEAQHIIYMDKHYRKTT